MDRSRLIDNLAIGHLTPAILYSMIMVVGETSTEFSENGNWRFGRGKESIIDVFIYLSSYEFVIHATALMIITFVNNIRFVYNTAGT